jgi:hypothetical protein
MQYLDLQDLNLSVPDIVWTSELQRVPVIEKAEILRETIVPDQFLSILSRRLSFLAGELPQQHSVS